ncbi:MAG TPA: N-acetylmuramoyl-L-alanine amidase [Clostridia bacterium]
MIAVIHKKKIIIISCIFICLVIAAVILTSTVQANRYIPRLKTTIVIDAGHGGIDGGVTGVNTKVKESELNLKVAKKLEKYFKSYGFDVVMTRTNSDGLYGGSVKNFKQKDMKARAEIIRKAKPDAVISIHMNFFSQSKQRGAQVFYKKGNEAGKELARNIQETLALNIEYCNRLYLSGDYYIVNCTDYPSVIVECGFLSNADDEALLITDEYQEKLAYHIMLGCMKFLDIAPYEIDT